MSSVADRRAAALEGFARAKDAGRGFNGNWEEIATQLAALLPVAKAPKVEVIDREGVWADYKPPRRKQPGYDRGLFVVTLADGEVFELHHSCDSRKPYNWGAAIRIAQSFWRSRKTAGSGRTCIDREKLQRKLKPPKAVSLSCNGRAYTGAIPEAK